MLNKLHLGMGFIMATVLLHNSIVQFSDMDLNLHAAGNYLVILYLLLFVESEK